EPDQEEVAGLLLAARGKADRVVELGVGPVEDELQILGQMPVEPEVRLEEAGCPKCGVGQSRREDVLADVQEPVTDERLDRPPAETTLANIERMEGFDDADAAPCLPGQQVAGLDVVALDRDAGPRGEIADQRVILVAALPLADDRQLPEVPREME